MKPRAASPDCSGTDVSPSLLSSQNNELAGKTRRHDSLDVSVAVGDQTRRGPSGTTDCAVNVIESDSSLEEKHRASALPNMLEKPKRLGACKNQGYAIAMFGEPFKPLLRVRVRRIQPHAPGPRRRQPIVIDGEVVRRNWPRAFDRRAGIEIERAKGLYDSQRSKPFILGTAGTKAMLKAAVCISSFGGGHRYNSNLG